MFLAILPLLHHIFSGQQTDAFPALVFVFSFFMDITMWLPCWLVLTDIHMEMIVFATQLSFSCDVKLACVYTKQAHFLTSGEKKKLQCFIIMFCHIF